MFPSTYCSLGPYPCFPSSGSASYSYPPFTFLNNPENNASANNTTPFLHDPLSVPYTHTTTLHAPIPETLTNWAVADCAAMLKQDLSGAHYGISNLLTKKPARKPAKKDRHSKIHTSQGLRDRRVRLSIEIARKFFDLQDMLGFDKASNTLAWLFNKSNKAIEELTRIKHSSSGVDDDHVHGFSSSSSEGEVVSKDLMDTILDLQQQQQQQKQRVDSEERKLKRAQKEPACVRAKMKESREKARARARERTSGKVQDLEKKSPATENPQILHQLRPYEDTAISPRLVQPHPHLVGSELQRDDDFNVIEESIVIKRKLKQSSVSSSHHQNTVIPKEASFDNSDCHCHSFPMSPNWDANNAAATGRSNFCAIASMNLSAGLQIFGKSWEECYTSPHLY